MVKIDGDALKTKGPFTYYVSIFLENIDPIHIFCNKSACHAYICMDILVLQ